MSMLDLTGILDDIEGAEEPTIAEKDTEHKLRIVSVRGGEAGSNGCEYFSPVFEVMNAPMVKEFSTFLWVPTRDKMSEKQYARSCYELKMFADAFEIDLSRPIDYEDDLPGREGWAILGIKKSDEYGEQNTIKKYIIPR
jgi:hypothetical protein